MDEFQSGQSAYTLVYGSPAATTDSGCYNVSTPNRTAQQTERPRKQKQPNPAMQQVSFIMCGAPSDAQSTAARREVRSQAARRSAEQRKATIAKRYAGKPEEPRARRRAARKPAQVNEATPAQACVQASPVKAPLPPAPLEDSIEGMCPLGRCESQGVLEIDVAALVGTYINNALSVLDPIACEYAWQSLSPRTLVSSFFSATLANMNLALSTGAKSGPRSNQTLSRPLVLWMRQDMLVAINGAIASGACPSDQLAAAVAVAAGWEGQFGDPDMCDVHLRAFRDIISRNLAQVRFEQAGYLSGQSTPALSACGSWSPMSSTVESPGPVASSYMIPGAPVDEEDSLFQQRIAEDAYAAVYQPLFH